MAAEALDVQEEIGDLAGIARTLETAAAVLGPGPNGILLLAAADRLRRCGCDARPAIPPPGVLTDPPVVSAWAEGAALSTAEVVALAAALLSGTAR